MKITLVILKMRLRKVMTMSQEYAVQGLSCASCAHAVEVALQAVTGVKSAQVNLATEKVSLKGVSAP